MKRNEWPPNKVINAEKAAENVLVAIDHLNECLDTASYCNVHVRILSTLRDGNEYFPHIQAIVGLRFGGAGFGGMDDKELN